jgi:hypothetical protein
MQIAIDTSTDIASVALVQDVDIANSPGVAAKPHRRAISRLDFLLAKSG